MHLNVLIYSSTTLSKEEQKTILHNADEIIFISALSSSRLHNTAQYCTMLMKSYLFQPYQVAEKEEKTVLCRAQNI